MRIERVFVIVCAVAALYVGWEYFNSHDAGIGAGIIAVCVIYMFLCWKGKIDEKQRAEEMWNDFVKRARFSPWRRD
jgi:hypothetical protein